jgi:hypothetical protein
MIRIVAPSTGYCFGQQPVTPTPPDEMHSLLSTYIGDDQTIGHLP